MAMQVIKTDFPFPQIEKENIFLISILYLVGGRVAEIPRLNLNSNKLHRSFTGWNWDAVSDLSLVFSVFCLKF